MRKSIGWRMIISFLFLMVLTTTLAFSQVLVIQKTGPWSFAIVDVIPPPAAGPGDGGDSESGDDGLDTGSGDGGGVHSGSGYGPFCSVCHGIHKLNKDQIEKMTTQKKAALQENNKSRQSKENDKSIFNTKKTILIDCLDCHEKRLSEFTRTKDGKIILEPSPLGKIHIQGLTKTK